MVDVIYFFNKLYLVLSKKAVKGDFDQKFPVTFFGSISPDLLLFGFKEVKLTNFFDVKNSLCANNYRIKSKKVRFWCKYLRDFIQARAIQLILIPSADNIADIFTKPLGKQLFQYLRAKFVNVQQRGACMRMLKRSFWWDIKGSTEYS